ncbi:hypothetical protein EVJ27_08925 [Exiguobacterium sp. SH3S2]|uniref:hypothetical protein n=1 Tax=unclassified Exiguobacterium TaxID=2644629 RepID=UPI00103D4206|nr:MULTISPECIES: hypothetical protein [unclassified Exiguobacterium]TCI26911.1 hypothetical protein EVJ32_03920 [Exiguobacterium sp. SH5S4]TCI44453.1 hypothetical protein EVJ28_08925 [Exiguobacterium sp. SH3S3]TCI56854.1 hypothetical protein EVJ30_03145 [Exiguobacterium sp. SH5S13]TCI60011.1 hypothetical protein EVJ27_08925 [Exiguobacterium sp. SH3S2]
MRIGKLRMLLEQYGETTLRDLVVEMYRNTPKAVIEEKDMDYMISQFTRYKEQKSSDERHSLSQTVILAERFVELAYDHLYLLPNQIMSERDQKNWYIHAKKIIRDLSYYAEDDAEARTMYEEMFLLLSSSAGEEPLFSTSDPFRLLKLSQTTMLTQLIHYYQLDAPTSDVWIDRSLYTALHVPKDVDSTRVDLLSTLLEQPYTSFEWNLFHQRLITLCERTLAKAPSDDSALEDYQALKMLELELLVERGQLSEAERKLFSEYIPFFSHRSEPFKVYVNMLESRGHSDETKRLRRLAKEKRINL